MADGPLRDVRVLDLTHVWAGPLATRILGDLGADVVRVEGPASRGPREFPEQPIAGFLGGNPGEDPWNRNAIFVKLGRNKRSLCVDLKTARGRDLLLDLVGVADVLIENFSARAMPSLRLGWDVLRERNEQLIYVSMPGFGMDGPYRDRVAFGPTVEAMSGLTQAMGYGPDEPRNTAMALMDPVSALTATAAITRALRERARTGSGQLLELSLHEGGVSLCGPWVVDQQLGHRLQPIGNRHPGMSPHGVFPAAGSDAWVAVACRNDRDWRALCRLIGGGDPELRLLDRRRAEPGIEDWIAAWTKRHSPGDAAARLLAAGIPAGAVQSAPEMTEDPQTLARGFFVELEPGPTPVPGNPIHVDGVGSADWSPCPALGAHNREVLKDWLDLDDTSIATLLTDGVLADRPPA